MSDDREHRIRNRAYQRWEQEGRPEGRHDDHWRDAAASVDADDESPDLPVDEAPMPPAADPIAEQAPLAPPSVDDDQDRPVPAAAAASPPSGPTPKRRRTAPARPRKTRT